MKFKRRHKTLNDTGPPCCNNCIKEMTKRSINPRPMERHINKTELDAKHLRRPSMKFHCKYCTVGFMEQKALIMHEIQHAKTAKNDLSNHIMPMHIQ